MLFCISFDLLVNCVFAVLGRRTLVGLSFGGSLGLLAAVARVIISDGFRFCVSLLLGGCGCVSSLLGLGLGIGSCGGLGVRLSADWDVDLKACLYLGLRELWQVR